jgi:hypothetical protein
MGIKPDNSMIVALQARVHADAGVAVPRENQRELIGFDGGSYGKCDATLHFEASADLAFEIIHGGDFHQSHDQAMTCDRVKQPCLKKKVRPFSNAKPGGAGMKGGKDDSNRVHATALAFLALKGTDQSVKRDVLNLAR